MMNLIFEKLLKHCTAVYAGKSCRNGMPYILHPLAVMSKVKSLPEKIVALAHDYGEFRDIDELFEIGVPAVLIENIRKLAKNFPDNIPENDPRYCDYIWNLLDNPVCRMVKYADLLVNDSWEDSPAGDGRRFTGRYPKTVSFLADAINGKLYFSSKTPYQNIFSNFYQEPVMINGTLWRTGEHFYQAEKFNTNGLQPDKMIYEAICQAETPGMAKSIADQFFSEENKQRSHFAVRTFIAMNSMLKAKFSPDTLFRKRLMQTGNLELIHQSKNDFFWGKDRNGTGKNILGKILMQMRKSNNNCSLIKMIACINDDMD